MTAEVYGVPWCGTPQLDIQCGPANVGESVRVYYHLNVMNAGEVETRLRVNGEIVGRKNMTFSESEVGEYTDYYDVPRMYPGANDISVVTGHTVIGSPFVIETVSDPLTVDVFGEPVLTTYTNESVVTTTSQPVLAGAAIGLLLGAGALAAMRFGK